MTFSIRDILWLTLLSALAVAWWLDHRRLQPPEEIVFWKSPGFEIMRFEVSCSFGDDRDRIVPDLTQLHGVPHEALQRREWIPLRALDDDSCARHDSGAVAMKLTLRDVFWLALVVALMLGWWIHQSQLKSEL